MNLNNLMTIYNQIKNPQQFLQKMGIPREHLNTPQDAARFLMENGKVTQDQINQASQLYNQMFKR